MFVTGADRMTWNGWDANGAACDVGGRLETMKGKERGNHAVRRIGLVAGSLLAVLLVGCVSTTKIPKEYSTKAEPNVTLTKLAAQQDAYLGKIVILGGVILDSKKDTQGRTWMLVRNRPLDSDYIPHLPVSTGDLEAGSFWMILDPTELPMHFKAWARVTVVGTVTNENPTILGGESVKRQPPVLDALYLHGWDTFGAYAPKARLSQHDARGTPVQPSIPADLRKN